jgi:ABC-2 type transport system ATP-binding protein
MHDPVLLLLDEPTTGLDPQARRSLWELLKEQHERGLTIVLTTHYMEEADRLCERLAIVDHGRILTEGTPAALRRSLPGGRVLDLWARGGAPLGDRLGALAGVLGVEPVTDDQAAHPGVERLRLFVETQDGLLDRVLQEVRSAGAELDHVSLSQPSLEDVYIHLTGKELRE